MGQSLELVFAVDAVWITPSPILGSSLAHFKDPRYAVGCVCAR